eukprot:TRINITY_DN39142_c0_g1_i1.p1 TRINITY_DN39142_c0_g1~~TRINITY_DN39142_c0_g1_i1.p1  ORF type:complete len:801 (-),score=103.28 TRINITY_DN39142_c0_g1_i1:48-2348(-)
MLVASATVLALIGFAFADHRSGEVSDSPPSCSQDLEQYFLCGPSSALFTICSTSQFLQNPTVKSLLNCTSSKDCQNRCLLRAGQLLNQSHVQVCSSELQAMQSFSGQLNIFTLDQIDKENISHAVVLPFPDTKGIGSVSITDLGQPSKCAEISTGQYCVITGTLASQPFPFSLRLGTCLPKSCSEAELNGFIAGKNSTTSSMLHVQCDLVQPLGPAEGIGKEFSDALGWGGVPVKFPNHQEITTGFVVTVLVIVLFSSCLVAGTVLDFQRQAKERMLSPMAETLVSPGLEMAAALDVEQTRIAPRGRLEGFLHHWSLVRNVSSFLRLRVGRENPFACMDAIRTLSMIQVISGHMFVYPTFAAGFSNIEQFSPPYGVLGQLWFMLIPGCFYGVDSFFLLSGFLCCYGLQKKVFSNSRNQSMSGFCSKYPFFIIYRYLRLVPLEIVVILIFCCIVPYMGTGVLWNLGCYEGTGANACRTHWWVNLLFLQDSDTLTRKGLCLGHTWYLANDFQLYLTAPFFCWAYGIKPKLGWLLLALGLCVGVFSPMIITVQQGFVPEVLLAAKYSQKIYFKPWCRCTPFFVGIGLAWLWEEHLKLYTGRHRTLKGRYLSFAVSAAALLLCAFVVYIRIFFYQCSLEDCQDPEKNPVPRFLQILWPGLSILGWSVGLGTIMILCFQDRFLPVLQQFLSWPVWQPFAKLSYAAYLIHPGILILDYCQRPGPVDYYAGGFIYAFVSYVILAMSAAFALYLLVEKPLANLQMALTGGAGGD